MKNKHIKHSFKYRKLLVLSLFAIVILTGAYIIAVPHSHKKIVSGPIKTVEGTGSPRANQNNADQTIQDKSSSGGQIVKSGGLLAPYGALVSNHRPGQNGSDLREVSQCITSPGAACYIKLSQGSITKTLPKKTTASDGSIYWEWDVNNSGLTKGKWSITAVAELDNQTRTTTDQLSLEIQ